MRNLAGRLHAMFGEDVFELGNVETSLWLAADGTGVLEEVCRAVSEQHELELPQVRAAAAQLLEAGLIECLPEPGHDEGDVQRRSLGGPL